MSGARIRGSSLARSERDAATKAPAETTGADVWLRFGGAAGIAFVALTLAGGIVQGDVPVYADGATQIKQWFGDNAGRYLVGYYLIALAVLAYLAFLAGFTALLMRAERGAYPSSLFTLIAGVLVPAALIGSASFDGTLALLEGDVSDDVARVLSAADYYAYALVPLMLGLFSLASAVAIARTRVLWAPLAWAGFVIAAGGIAAGAVPIEQDPDGVLYTVGIVTLFAFFVWVLAISAAMLTQRRGR